MLCDVFRNYPAPEQEALDRLNLSTQDTGEGVPLDDDEGDRERNGLESGSVKEAGVSAEDKMIGQGGEESKSPEIPAPTGQSKSKLTLSW
jgi:hypothetical protein